MIEMKGEVGPFSLLRYWLGKARVFWEHGMGLKIVTMTMMGKKKQEER